MSNIRVDANFKIFDGAQISFKSPANFSDVTGLRVYYPESPTVTNSQDFIFADAHGVDVTDLDDLFGESAIVKVLLDTVHSRAFVQNADTNSYLESRFKSIEETPASADKIGMMSAADKKKLDGISGDTQQQLDDKLPIGEEVINSDVAYLKAVPNNSGKYAAVNKVGGMSYKSRNLLENTATTLTQTGVTFTTNEDGSVSVKGTSTSWTHYKLNQFTLLAGTYTLSLGGGINATLYVHIKDLQDNSIIDTYSTTPAESNFTLTKDTEIIVNLSVSPEKSVDTVVYPMIRRATETNSTYEPYYSGIRNAYVYQIESISKNHFDIGKTSDYFSTIGDGGIIRTDLPVNDTTTFNITNNTINIESYNNSGYRWISKWLKLAPNTDYTLSAEYINGLISIVGLNSNENTTVGNFLVNKSQISGTKIAISFNSGNYKYYMISFYPSSNGVRFEKIQIEAGITVTPYESYKLNTLEIPDAIKDLDGYGLGINEDCYNYIDYGRKKFVINCKKRILTENDNWIDCGCFGLMDFRDKKAGYNNFMNDKLPFNISTQQLAGTVYGTTFNGAEQYKNYFYVSLPNDIVPKGDINAFKTWIAENPITIAYQIEPEEIDISEYLPDDNFLEVVVDGVITTVNEYNYDAPTEISFYTSENAHEIVSADTFVGDLLGVAEKANVAVEANRLSNLIEDAENPGCFYRMVNGAKQWINPPLLKDVEYQTTERWLGKPVYTKVVSYTNSVSYINPNAKTDITISTETQDFHLLVRYSGLARPASSSSSLSKRIMPIPGFTFDEEGTIGEGTGSIGIRYMSSSKIVLACNGPSFSVGTTFFVQVWYTKSETA